MNFINKNKGVIFVVVIFLGIVILIGGIKNILMPNDARAVYGDRLDGIEEHPLEDSLYTDIETKLKENVSVLKVEHYLHGKIINLIITVNDDVSVSNAKKIANSTISMFSSDSLSYYSLQVYVKKDNAELNNFPIIGYKGPTTKELVFTKDRDITKEKEEKNEE